jgi:tRNA pseudouridine38-40 synthase
MTRLVNRYLLGVQYAGSQYNGSVRVGEIMSHAMEKFIGSENFENLHVSSRTDSGVHALRNVWHADLHFHENAVISNCLLAKRAETVMRALNHYLRKENIIIIDCINVPLHFDCRHNAKYRTYMYR